MPADSTQSTTSSKSPYVPVKLRFKLKTLDGVEFDGASLAGKAAVLWFWAPWCGYCQEDAELIAEFAKAYADKISFVGVAGRDVPEAMKKFIVKYKLDGFPQLVDADDSVFTKARVSGTPTVLFFRSDGTNTAHVGSITKEQLVAELDKLSQP